MGKSKKKSKSATQTTRGPEEEDQKPSSGIQKLDETYWKRPTSPDEDFGESAAGEWEFEVVGDAVGYDGILR